MKPHPFIALAGWIAFWVVHQALQEPRHETPATMGLILLVLPQILLGFVARRWWVAGVPLAVGAWFTIWAVNHPTGGLSEIANVPVLLGVVAAMVVCAGVVLSRLLARRLGAAET